MIDCIGNAPSAKPINGAIDGAPNAAREYPSGQAIIIRKLHHQRSELVLDDQGRSEAAVQCLRKALVVAPDYLDAIFNLALMLQRKGAYAEAAVYWRQYLAGDRASEWTSRARRSLKFCEIQVNAIAYGQGSANSDKAA